LAGLKAPPQEAVVEFPATRRRAIADGGRASGS